MSKYEKTLNTRVTKEQFEHVVDMSGKYESNESMVVRDLINQDIERTKESDITEDIHNV